MKVLVCSDSIRNTTGFANVARPVIAECVRRGWEVVQIAGGDQAPDIDSRPFYEMGVRPYFPRSDELGLSIFEHVVTREQPDAMLVIADPGTTTMWHSTRAGAGVTIPCVVYCPVEGAPLSPGILMAFEYATAAYTYTQWGSDRIADQRPDWNVPWLHHGIDHDVFQPLSADVRAEWRTRLGWADKFVVSYVARNGGRKGHDRLLKAASVLVDQGMEDVHLYMHTRPDMASGLELAGWDLQFLARMLGISERVQWQDETTSSTRGEDAGGLALKLACSDLYVSPSAVEGFGLPLVEAMACGVPVIHVNDGGNQVEVTRGGVAGLMPPSDWETWFTGAFIAKVSQYTIAQTITDYRALSPEQHEAFRQRGLAHAAKFTWNRTVTELADALMRVVDMAQHGYVDPFLRPSVPAGVTVAEPNGNRALEPATLAEAT